MKGIYKNNLVDIVERDEKACRIQTHYGVINTHADEVLPVADKLYYQYAAELQQNDEYREDIRKKQEEIKQRYYAKKDELEKLSAKAWHRKQAIIKELYYKALSEA